MQSVPASFSLVSPDPAPGGRRILAIVLPELLEELALERVPRVGPRVGPRGALPVEGAGRGSCSIPRAVVLVEDGSTGLEPTARLDAVNGAARRLGVSPRQTIAQASAIIENLVLHAVPLARVSQALQQLAEAALGFGSPVAFRAPDTVWVDISGTCHLFGGAHPLALMLSAHVRALGHSARVAVASGPWLARAFAQHADFDETGVFLADASREAQQAGSLPIAALPITGDTVAWFSRLGLLSLDDLRALPRTSLAARLGTDAERMLDLIHGRDDGPLDAYHPEELPFEQQSWDTPLDNVEPLLFVLKGLCGRLASRLEGRGQAARELQLTIQYDKSIAALRQREREAAALGSAAALGPAEARRQPASSALRLLARVGAEAASAPGGQASHCAELRLQLASPLLHADDLERICRARLQRETLHAPASGLRLQVTSITEARHWQLGLNADAGLGQLGADPSLITVLMNELSADVGDAAVGLLETDDSHLLEKRSRFVPAQSPRPKQPCQPAQLPLPLFGARAARLPTRLIAPVELEAALDKNELVVIEQRAFVIESVRFEERLESVEWWASKPVSRDYFRLWLSALSAGPAAASPRQSRDGLEVLVYVDRDDGKKYVHAIYD